MKHLITSIILLCIASLTTNAQQLKVIQSPDDRKVNIDTRNGVSSIVFESKVKDLVIDNQFNDEKIKNASGMTFFMIQPRTPDVVEKLGHPKREFLLKSPITSEYLLETPEILPGTVLFYTVVMPNQFPLSFSAEYLFTKSAKYGVRASFGKQFGGYVSYKWGEYNPSGNDVANIQTDADLTDAEFLGYIRKSITAGFRFGVFHRNINKHNYGLYLLVGGGYGEYGRQWKNLTQIDGNIYFYSDYMKGFNGELALQAMIYDWLTISGGIDMLVDKGSVSVDYMFGIGLNLNLSNPRK